MEVMRERIQCSKGGCKEDSIYYEKQDKGTKFFCREHGRSKQEALDKEWDKYRKEEEKQPSWKNHFPTEKDSIEKILSFKTYSMGTSMIWWGSLRNKVLEKKGFREIVG